MGKKLSLEEVKNRINQKHNGKYDLSLIKEYKNNRTKLPIICEKHGVFYSSADKLFSGCGCPKCAKNCKMDNDSFKDNAVKIHGDKYNYDKAEYKNSETKIKIICNQCGSTFWQTPHMHLRGQGCPNCNGNVKKNSKDFIAECEKVHNNKYDYSKTIYKNAYSKIIVTCPIHGDFEQIARVHLNGHGCPKCSGKHRYDKDYFIEKAKEIHGNKYDYSLIKTIESNREKLPIICPKHGVFTQTIDKHINQKSGCPKCQRSLLEEEISILLKENNYEFEEQKHFQWLGLQSLDFYLPKYKIAIECQGIQHFIPYGNFGSKKNSKEELFESIDKLDSRKNELCKKNGILILYYSNVNLEYKYTIYKSKDELLKKLKEFG